jgi:ribosomal protein L35
VGEAARFQRLLLLLLDSGAAGERHACTQRRSSRLSRLSTAAMVKRFTEV